VKGAIDMVDENSGTSQAVLNCYNEDQADGVSGLPPAPDMIPNIGANWSCSITTSKTTAKTIDEGGGGDGIKPRMIGAYTEQFLVEKAKEMMEKRTKTWEIATFNDGDRIPRLRTIEVELGNELGKGGFFSVFEIKKIKLQGDTDLDESDSPEIVPERNDVDDEFTGVIQNRRFMERNCIRKGKNPRYCYKTMQDHCRDDPKLFVSTMVDLAIEATFLSSVRHPHIIKMRAMSDGFISSGDAFIVLDKLYGTLEAKIEEWKVTDTNSFARLFDFRGKYAKAFLAERLTVAYDIGSALCYLHDRK
jgi:hypothetical protein